MTTTRALTLAFAFAAVLTFTGCPSKNCSDASPPVSQVPAGCTAPTGSKVTVQVRACPKCDQSIPTCLVHAENIGGGSVLLEPVSEVCDPNSGCPISGTCMTNPLTCTFTAPATPGTVTVTVNDPSTPQEFTLTVNSGAAGDVTCSL